MNCRRYNQWINCIITETCVFKWRKKKQKRKLFFFASLNLSIIEQDRCINRTSFESNNVDNNSWLLTSSLTWWLLRTKLICAFIVNVQFDLLNTWMLILPWIWWRTLTFVLIGSVRIYGITDKKQTRSHPMNVQFIIDIWSMRNTTIVLEFIRVYIDRYRDIVHWKKWFVNRSSMYITSLFGSSNSVDSYRTRHVSCCEVQKQSIGFNMK
jgi:hypothetical protein